MSKTKKVLLGGGVILALAIGTYAAIQWRDRGVVAVQTGKVVKLDNLVQTVSASGEIKPLKYINITANSFGRIVEIAVKEGDHVKQGDLLLKQESVQPSADLRSNQALLQQFVDDAEGLEAAYQSSQAQLKTSQADLVRAQADFEKARLDFERNENLLKEGLIPKSQFDQMKASFEVSKAQVDSAQARVLQARALLNQSDKARVSGRGRIAQQTATIARLSDLVSKTVYLAPITSVVTSLPVRVGESAVPGIQNAIGSNLMTLADLSVITAEVKADETDIVNVKLGQEADVSVDALPNKIFRGKVTEVGSSALIRSSGQAAGSGITNPTMSQQQEAKDFKVVVTLLDPSEELKPGLSTTAKITTAVRSNVLAIPIQALTVREPEKEQQRKEPSSTPKSAKADNEVRGKETMAAKANKKKEQQGVFIVRDLKSVFIPVRTGITGQTEIEVLSGLKEGDEIITGSYKTLRTIKTEDRVKVDNKAVEKEDQKG
jgi:HlyD family secretion protein